ncbi:hypothetical protein [Streptomyces endophyticus]|uniref:Uncharacterized protein n=1 Tax=Streptomyces endophyticus TaxID=714166 RepID=A0ABU6F397_9ACTN|nr:hypothetical protein [Streptomyces endophyticus]MEB8338329.1 hypothetical protein [Streptomyces endophyticus]
MYGLLSKLAELLAQFGSGLVTLRRTAQDTDVAAALLRCAVALQDLCVRGERLLALADGLVDGADRPGAAREFVGLVQVQAEAVDSLRGTLVECQELLATVDAEVYVRLAPFLDAKSGLLTRWQQQATMSALSTTTLFFLPQAALDEVLAVGRAHATSDGLAADRTDYLLAIGDGMRAARAREVRDLSRAAATRHAPAVRDELAGARDELTRAGALCRQLVDSVKESVGPEAMARLRRQLVPKQRAARPGRRAPV